MKLASLLTLIICLCGCQTAPKPVAEKNLAQQVAHDPQAQSALRSINTALSAQHTVKYCPENGERFSADMIWCPDHKVRLEWVD